ncbi:MAG TPA: exonuclease domain-containing protein [candidate division Zixibacteria bacterium]|nr:exonuclease domain-containing protein [candidate division Zixibacteria bacterium]
MKAAENRSEYLLSQKFIAFDTETTGMWAAVNRVVEIAAVKFTLGGGETDRFQFLINPERPIPEEVIAVHGITDDMVRVQPTAAQVLPGFIEFCESAVLVAHNAPFDIGFIGYELSRTELTFADNIVLDTVDIFHRFFPGLPSYSLLNLIRHFNLAQTQEHRALSDALFVKSLFELAAEKFPAVSRRNDFKRFLTVHSLSRWEDESATLPDEYSDLNYAVEQKMRVEIMYSGSSNPGLPRTIRPIQVIKKGRAFYIHAFCEQAGAERTFRLDRITSYTIISKD